MNALRPPADETYHGFEQGPIRPPSEAHSLLLRVTRNCPWNRCRFCPVYKGSRFSLRPVDHVKRDIDEVARAVKYLRETATSANSARSADQSFDPVALSAAIGWVRRGMRSVFLQDANSPVQKPAKLIEILTHLRERFPEIQRVTSYARSHTIQRISDADLKLIGEAGLNRIHIGLESGCDEVLQMVEKGVTRAVHIEAGQKVKRAGIELSEYVMPGLGGVRLSETHALETADALNQINPAFIRLRSLAVPQGIGIHEDMVAGRFEPCTDEMVAREIRLFIASLNGITSTVKSDHILNLFEDVAGTLPEAQTTMLAIIDSFLEMAPEQKVIYQVGRRMGVFSGPEDLAKPHRLARAERVCREFGIHPGNVGEVTREMMTRFV